MVGIIIMLYAKEHLMRIDLSPLATGKTQAIAFDYRMESDPGLIFEHLSPTESRPILGEGVISKSGRRFVLQLKYSGQVTVSCDRCLEPFEYSFAGQLTQMLEKGEAIEAAEDDDGQELRFFEGDSVDIDPIVADDIVLNLPLRMLCKPECEGLCQNCGQNLNTGSCACELDTVDPRMAALQELLRGKEV